MILEWDLEDNIEEVHSLINEWREAALLELDKIDDNDEGSSHEDALKSIFLVFMQSLSS